MDCSESRLCCLQVEVCQSSNSTARSSAVEDRVRLFLQDSNKTIFGDVLLTEFPDDFLARHVQSVSICDTDLTLSGGASGSSSSRSTVCLAQAQLDIHVFQLHQDEDGPAAETIDDQEEEISAAGHWLLPSTEFQGLWENLIYDVNVKEKLLQYATTTLLFSDHNVDCNVVSWNRVILLHGPPGTGKTSLCKALAQKLCIRFSKRYTYGQLVEINSHGLFSKWFSESGKLVQKMFDKIQELIDDPDALVCVLIDEVESLTMARKAAMSGSEPSDSIRVVNALLTQIDRIKRHSNVIILTTSNMTGAIDLAFVDRADIKQYIGLPTPPAIYRIYQSCLAELMRTGIIAPPQQLLGMRDLEVLKFVENDATRHSLKLFELSKRSEGLSGRTLRKLPFLAHVNSMSNQAVSLDVFMEALSMTITRQFEERSDMQRTSADS
ncbi:pachytene checkpoint protein 2 homolog [Sycon ciliatum]|uniref:pachytene checkpoint protein 2 homolog n=1 Tax=Sycon ciliatum TaxID=27933 RepID=UPI0020AAEA81|eukprot:scpid61603/ scgid31389/ Pachytene checkpoint protein 2 homolog; Thyroid hormone receptor interactor 13 homolog; Thyroid receptor-interacting protein 13 homolog